MKKYILTLFIALMGILSVHASATDIKLEQVINGNISEVVVNIPSTLKVYQSFDDNTHIRFRSTNMELLDNVYYKYDNKQLCINTNKLNNTDIKGIVIYLYVPNNNIKYYTENRGLDIKTTSYNKNINISNHEENN